MKSINKIITAVIGIMLMSAVSGYAYSDSTFSELKINSADGFYTVLTDTEGDIHTYNGIISAKDIESSDEVEKIESYTVYSGDEKIIDTKLNDIVSRNTVDLFNEEGKIITNGYYSVKFEIDDNNEVFLTGLSDSNIDMVQDKLIKSKLNGEGLELESFDFIDAEKTNLPNDGDDELCWAASTSNILHYTGWGKKVGFDSTDDIFDDFRDNFTDVGGNTYYGIEWFFNGMYRVQGVDGWAQAKNYGSNGKYLKQYSANDVFEYIDFSNNHKNFNNAATALENGCGLSLNLGWLDNDDNRTGGHAISLWGYVCDKNLENDNSEYYKAIIVSDSDSDEQADENRRLAPNKLNVLNIKPYQTESLDSWKLCNYSDGLIENVIALKPYNDNIEYETDESATLDKFADYDFTVSDINMSNDELDSNANINKFSTNDNIYINPIFSNPSLKSFDGTLDYSITLTDKADNSEKGSWSGTYSGKIKSFETSDILNAEKIKIEKLPVGEYTVAVTVNSDKTVGEAYYIKEFGNSEDEITFDDDIDTVYLNSPIIIDSDVKIKGKYSESNSEPLIIQGSQKAQLFNVTQNGSLDCEIVSFYSGLSKIYGGAIENKGGNVSLQNCLVLSNKSGSAGGGIYSDGGNVKLLNCVFSENTSGYGGAVYVAGGARLDMLNCTLFENSSNSGAFYNNGGQANIIYSTFNNNTATSSGGGAVTDNGKTNLIGSIASNNGETDIDGKVNVYGSFVTSVSDGVNIDDLTIKGSAYKIFVCSPQNQTNWYYDKTSYKTELSPFINEGVYVKNSDGKIAYSSDGTKWNVTDISSAFTDDDYKKDTLGNTHERLFGSVNETYEDGRLVSVEDDRAYVYVPKAQNAVFIEKDMTRDGVLNGVHMYEISLDVGTNVINLDENDSDSDLKDYMVWNNLENMCSIIVNR